MDDVTVKNTDVLLESTLKQLRAIRRSLLQLHKLLLGVERADFERLSGPFTSGELLQLVINHAQFAWLRLISALIVEIDEMLSADEPATLNQVRDLISQARRLLTAPESQEFGEKYQAVLQREPAVVMVHSEAMKLLRQDES